jgi:hypothetical protein
METLLRAATPAPNLEPFDYMANFGNESLSNQARATHDYFKGFLRRTFKGLIELGKHLWEFYEACCREIGAEQGRKAFDDWLASEQFGGSRYLADTAMALSPWYQNLPKALQRLLATRVDSWSLSALKELPRLTYDLVEKLVKEGKQTAKSIRCALSVSQGKRYLTWGELATETDWQLISEKYEIFGDNLDSLRLEAQTNATINPETGLLEIKTDDLLKALETFGYDSALVLPKPKSQKRYTEQEVEQIRQETIAIFEASKTAEITQIIEAKERASEEAQAAKSQLESLLSEQQKTYEKFQQQIQIQYQAEVEKLQQQVAEKAVLEAENSHLRQRITELEQSPSLSETQEISQEILQEYEQKLASQESQINQLSRLVEKFKRLELPLSDELLFPGASVQVIADVQGREGATGTVQNQSESGWWILLDWERETGQQRLFKAEQLAFNFKSSQSSQLAAENHQLKQQIQSLEKKLELYNLERLSSNQKSFQKRKKPQGFGFK